MQGTQDHNDESSPMTIHKATLWTSALLTPTTALGGGDCSALQWGAQAQLSLSIRERLGPVPPGFHHPITAPLVPHQVCVF